MASDSSLLVSNVRTSLRSQKSCSSLFVIKFDKPRRTESMLSDNGDIETLDIAMIGRVMRLSSN